MRYVLVAAAVVAGFVSSSAVGKEMAPTRSWMECFRLSVFRGTDAWMDEQQDFIQQCVEGKIAFGDDFPVHAMRLPRDQEQRTQ